MLLHPPLFRICTGFQPTVGVETGKEIMIEISKPLDTRAVEYCEDAFGLKHAS